MIVKFKKLNENAKLPQKAKEGDFCYDVYAATEEEIMPNVWRYGLGFALQIKKGEEKLEFYNKSHCTDGLTIDFRNSPIIPSIDFRPRSSVWETGMVLSNCEGTIDLGFTGEIKAVFYHVIPTMERYHVGDRIGQIKIGFTLPITFEEVDELSETERGDGGFGHTGR